MPVCFKDKNFVNTLDDSSKRWLQNLNRTLSINYNQNISNQKNNSENSAFIPNNQNFNQMNNMQNMNVNGYDNFYYNNSNNMNYIPNDQNNFFVNSNNPQDFS